METGLSRSPFFVHCFSSARESAARLSLRRFFFLRVILDQREEVAFLQRQP